MTARSQAAAGLVLAAAAVIALAGCTSPVAKAPAPRTPLETDIAALADAQGLVVNPVDARRTLVDVYGSAQLVAALQSDGVPVHLPRLDASLERVLAASDKALGLPRAWKDWSYNTLAAVSGNAGWTSHASASVPLPLARDLGNDATTEVWLAAVAIAAPGSRVPARTEAAAKAVVREDVRAGTADPTSAWRLTQACLALDLGNCAPRFDHVALPAGHEGAQEVFDWYAASELVHHGAFVKDFDAGSAASAASRELNGLAQGQDLLASTLSRVVELGGGGTSAITRYMKHAQSRQIDGSSLLRAVVVEYGSLANTFTAMRILGARFRRAASPHLVDTLENHKSTGNLLDDLRRVALLRALGAAAPASAARDEASGIAALRRSMADPERLQPDLTLLELLRTLQVHLPRLHAPIVIASASNEPTVARLLTQAGDDVFDNSGALLKANKRYLAGLVTRVTAEGATSPFFLDRVSIIDLAPGELTIDQRSRIGAQLRRVRGCAKLPALYREGADAAAPCELGRTFLGVNSGLEHVLEER